jgi:exosome complex component RRP4
LDGEVDNIMHGIKAIQMIEQDAHSHGLTEKVKAYLEQVSGQTAPRTE